MVGFRTSAEDGHLVGTLMVGTPWCPTQDVVYREMFWDVSPQNLDGGKI